MFLTTITGGACDNSSPQQIFFSRQRVAACSPYVVLNLVGILSTAEFLGMMVSSVRGTSSASTFKKRYPDMYTVHLELEANRVCLLLQHEIWGCF